MTTRNLLACAISAAIATAACAADNGETLETIFIKTQRGYSADATETNRDYSAFAATVGTKIPATPREIPQSISIITSQQIKDRNVETLDQLARKTPGLRVLSNDDGRTSIYARGYEYDEYNVNGLPAQMQSINGTLPNLAAFDRVEIMRGPSGLFDSSGEMGGLVNLVRKRPGEDFDASASAGYGTEKQYKLGGDITGKLNADGKPFACKARRHIYRCGAAQIDEYGKHIGQIHFHGIFGFLPELKRGGRTGRAQNTVVRFVQFCNIALNAGANAHRLFVTGARKLLGKHVIADDNAPLYFGAEAFAPRLNKQFVVAFAAVFAVTVADAVETA